MLITKEADMSEFYTHVVKLGKPVKHPNADTLEIFNVFETDGVADSGYPVISRIGDFKESDLAVYLSVDALVPVTHDKFKFLAGSGKKIVDNQIYSRLKAKRLRGIFSMGLLVKPDDTMKEGDNIADTLGIKKYEPDQFKSKGGGFHGGSVDLLIGGIAEKDPGVVPVYDLEGLRKYANLFTDGEEVIVTEKLHGCNWRGTVIDGKFYVGSRTRFIRKIDETNIDEVIKSNVDQFMDGKDESMREPFVNDLKHKMLKRPNSFWYAAIKNNLEEKLKKYPNLVVWAELVGGVSEMRYGYSGTDPELHVFDIYNTETKTFMDYDDLVVFCNTLGLKMVPLVYRGPFDREKIKEFTNGTTLLNNQTHIREGVVVSPVKERIAERFGRVKLKWVGEQYLLS